MAYIKYQSEVTLPNGKGTAMHEFEGLVTVFKIGNQSIRFALQPNKFGEQHKLIHVPSGRVCLHSDAIRHEKNKALLGGKAAITTREAARRALSALVERVGEGKVLATIMAAPVINK